MDDRFVQIYCVVCGARGDVVQYAEPQGGTAVAWQTWNMRRVMRRKRGVVSIMRRSCS